MFFWGFFKEKKTKMILYYYKKKNPQRNQICWICYHVYCNYKEKNEILALQINPNQLADEGSAIKLHFNTADGLHRRKKKWKWLLKQTEMSRCSCWKPLCMSLKYSQLTEHSNLTFCRLLPTLTSTGQMFKCRHALRSWWNLVLNLFCYQGISVITSVLIYFFKISVIINNK